MKVICGEGASELFAGFPASFPVPEDVAAGAASVRESNVANGSRRALESGFPRRRRGRLGSSIVSSEAGAGAEAFAVSGVAGALAASGTLGGLALAGGVVVGEVAGFCW